MAPGRPYARVVDGLVTHPKVVLIPRAERPAAMGTWVLALSWANEHLQDGYVPGHMVEEIGGTLAGAEALVAAKLWRRRGSGYVFVNWAEHQATREQVEQRREQTRRRVQAHRERKASTAQENSGPVMRYNSVTNAPSSSATDTRHDDDQSWGDPTSESTTARPIHPQPGDNPGDSSVPDYARIAEHVSRLTGRPCSTLSAVGIAEHYLERAKTPPRMANRYVVRCLNNEDPHVLTNYIDTGRWST